MNKGIQMIMSVNNLSGSQWGEKGSAKYPEVNKAREKDTKKSAGRELQLPKCLYQL